ncbi:MAG: hypothetical protein AAGA69_05060 [Pseudomonadota bacterium]
MSSTIVKQRSFWQWPETQGFALLLAIAGSLTLTGAELWVTDLFSLRLGTVSDANLFAPGADLTLVLARLFNTLPGVSLPASQSVATALAIPTLGLISYRTARRRYGRALRTLLICTHPLTLVLVLCGAGWAAVGLYVLWRSLSGLRLRRPHQGMAGTGLALAFAYLTVPGFQAFLLPLAAVLFLCAPRHMQGKFILSYYLAIFAPVVMFVLAHAYVIWAFGGEWISTPLTTSSAVGFPIAALFTLTATILSGPGLLRITAMGGTGARLAALVACAFAATAFDADPLTVAAMAALAQFALAAERGEPGMLSVLSFAGGAAIVIGLGTL